MRPLNLTVEQITFNALDSLWRHKYMMFGYWAAILVYERRRQGIKGSSPLAPLVKLARQLLTEYDDSTRFSRPELIMKPISHNNSYTPES